MTVDLEEFARTMNLLDQLKSKKSSLKSTITNITFADGTKEQIMLSKCGEEVKLTPSVQLKQKSYGFVVDEKPDDIPACIVDNFLYLGSQDSVMLENVIKYHLTDILSVGIQILNLDLVLDNGTGLTVCNHFVECLDLPNTQIKPIIEQTNQIIESVRKNNGRILIHCNAGVSRSSTVCIAYLMKHKHMEFKTAFELVKSKRECIRPNDGFIKQLQQMVKHDQLSVANVIKT